MGSTYTPRAKRALFPASTPQAMNKRLKLVERRTRLNKPEMKFQTFTLSGSVLNNALNNIEVTALATGDRYTDRIGSKVRIWRIECRGNMHNDIDAFVIQGHANSAPVASNFSGGIGQMIAGDDLNSKFSEWRYFYTHAVAGTANNGKFQMQHKFRNGIIAHYDGSGSADCTRNKLFVTFLNKSGATQQVNVVVRVWFTDA